MAEIPIKNSGKNAMHVGLLLLMPGETRIVDESLVPPHLRPNPPKPRPSEAREDPLLELLEESIPVVKEQVVARNDDGTPVISDLDFDRLVMAERAGKTRSGLMQVFAAQHMRRAAERAERGEGADAETEAYVKDLRGMSDDELLVQLELHVDDEAMTGLINAEIERREGAA
jgi:hypothetical protein